jgi:pimeloyl-ACP methyl ester carboxylesterase
MKCGRFRWVMMIALALASAISSCGREGDRAVDDTTGELALSGESTISALALLTGYRSCGKDPVTGEASSPRGAGPWPMLQKLVGELRAQGETFVPWIASCHASDSETFYFIAEGDETPTEGRWSDLLARWESVKDQAKESLEVVVMGHSWGGHDAIELLRSDDDSSWKALVTNDPVDPRYCNFSTVTFSGCRTGLRVTPKAEMFEARAKAHRWLNYYQYVTPALHSQPVDGADVNAELDVVHTQMDTHPAVWQAVREETFSARSIDSRLTQTLE